MKGLRTKGLSEKDLNALWELFGDYQVCAPDERGMTDHWRRGLIKRTERLLRDLQLSLNVTNGTR